ncbi:MAG: LacI family DNA-binding transcriptional regulator [Tractidigestivibacter sp.]|uniref:LacI family DNA-binding transcriptional regulator n=1 Tax=Tractidigestivibacter sp. TaxID=2847320 RepID=UPI002A80DFA1|nr:LacI family DNA-binding transcriptional regulator [Tractidigestivibacter sp.]MDY4535520.1 LacI family DNA-binding transcriptional regulator [Tractidigestivibacter sp.]
MRNVGVREISRRTGFSPATVSNALNNKRGVNKDTAETIRRVAAELGYEREGRLDHICFVLARKTGEVLDEGTFHPGVIEGVERAAKAAKLQTTLTTIELSNREAATRQAYEITRDTSNAVVLLGTEMAEEDYALFRDPVAPFVVVDGWSDRFFFESVVTQNENSAYRAVSYLVDCGHQEIGYIAGSYRIKNFPLRERGYRRAMREAGLPIDPLWRVEVGTTVTSSYNSMRSWLAQNSLLPTAFFVENDIMALGCMRAMAEKGIKIPEDVSMVGFDDLPYASICNPPLTTARIPNREMGEIAVRRMLDRIREPRDYTCVTHLSTTFVERQSVRRL